MNSKKACALLLAALAPIATASAASVVDSFNGVNPAFALTNDTPLGLFTTVGAAAGAGFTTGYEQPTGGVPQIKTNDLSVPLMNYVAGQGGSVNHWSVGAQIGTSARRVATRQVHPLSGTIWFSFLAALNNPAGDLGLTFNGVLSGTGQFGAGDGMRVGLGAPTRPGAFGVGPVASQATIANITQGVNGAITTNNFLPTDGTAGLVLGRISTDLATGHRRVDLWYNPEVANEAALPQPILTFIDSAGTIVPGTVNRIGYQVMRSTAVNELIDNVKLSDEPNGFDIVYRNAPLPLPLLNVSAVSGGETGPSNVVFTISADRFVSSALTVTYRLGGVATNGWDGGSGFVGADFTDPGFNVNLGISTVTIPAGTSNATVILGVIDDATPEGNESVILSVEPSSGYIIGVGSATALIIENNDANVSAQYMFTSTLEAQVWDPHMSASPLRASGMGSGFSGTAGLFYSPDASYRSRSDMTGSTAEEALAGEDYFSFTVSPVPGYALTVTNIQLKAMYANYLFQEPNAASAVIFARSSADNFASDLGSWVLQPDNIVFPNAWYTLDLDLGGAFANLPGGVEFRLYVYDDANQNQVGVRIDDLFIKASTAPAVGVQQLAITGVVDAAEPATAGSVTITRYGDSSQPLSVFYSLGGLAENGVDYAFLPGSIVIPAGQTTGVVVVSPIDDDFIEPAESLTLTIQQNANYTILGASSATLRLVDDGDIGGLAGYLFNEGNNEAASLSAVAKASVAPGANILAANAAAGPGLGNFGANSVAVGHGYATSAPRTPVSSLFMRGDALSLTAAGAFDAGDYVSFSLAPAPGYSLTLTNFMGYVKLAAVGQTTWVYLRSSQDGFAADLASATIAGTATEDPYTLFATPLSLTAATSATEYRLYFYVSRLSGNDITRVDDVSFQGYATPLQGAAPNITSISLSGGNVVIQFTGATSDDAAAFRLMSSTQVNGTFTEEAAAVISGSAGAYQATTTPSGATRFYRIRR